jgi:hypothetical protein
MQITGNPPIKKAEQPTVFRRLNSSERWLGGLPFMTVGSLFGGCLSMPFQRVPLILVAMVAGLVCGHRAFQRVSPKWQVFAYRVTMLVFVGFLTQFLFFPLPLALIGNENPTVEFAGCLTTFLLVTAPLSYMTWRATYKQLAVKPPPSAAENWKSVGV